MHIGMELFEILLKCQIRTNWTLSCCDFCYKELGDGGIKPDLCTSIQGQDQCMPKHTAFHILWIRIDIVWYSICVLSFNKIIGYRKYSQTVLVYWYSISCECSKKWLRRVIHRANFSQNFKHSKLHKISFATYVGLLKS